MTLLDEALARVKALDPAQKAALAKVLKPRLTGAWRPNPGPQEEAYHCKADLLLYGGQAAGGKTDLLLGSAMTLHKRSLIMRRQYTDLGALIERAVEISPDASVNRSPPPRIRLVDGRLIEFGAAKSLGDERNWQGQAHDLLAFDEAVQFLEAQVRFLMGWLRSADADQFCQTILATNPPVDASGDWIIGMFRPWLDITYHKPAKAGEIRWFLTTPDGKDMEVDGPDDIREWDGKTYIPKSRTFIPSSLDDNIYLKNTGYQSTLDALPEPYRSAVRDGNFMAARKDDDFQVIPTAWVIAARSRWTPRPPDGVPMCAMGVDMSGGGNDPLVIACRHDGWYAPLVEVPGASLSMEALGSEQAAHIMKNRRDSATIVMDMGGGYGSGAYEHLINNDIRPIAYKGAEKSMHRTADRKLGFVNQRSEAIWRFREALDPGQPGGSPIALPDDPHLTADLTAPTFAMTPNGIKVESKEDVVKRLGRSPDRGDAVVMAWHAGLKQTFVQGGWAGRDARSDNRGSRRSAPKVILRKPRG